MFWKYFKIVGAIVALAVLGATYFFNEFNEAQDPAVGMTPAAQSDSGPSTPTVYR